MGVWRNWETQQAQTLPRLTTHAGSNTA